MTKKMESIVKTYDEKLDCIVFEFKHDIIGYEKAKENLRNEYKTFESILTNMFFYNLISKNDFNATFGIPSNLYFKYLDKLVEINNK